MPSVSTGGAGSCGAGRHRPGHREPAAGRLPRRRSREVGCGHAASAPHPPTAAAGRDRRPSRQVDEPVTPSGPGLPSRRTVAIVMAAGLGTRMKSATPKVLHRLCGRALVEWVIEAAGRRHGHRPLVVYSPATDGVRDAVAGRADTVLQQVRPARHRRRGALGAGGTPRGCRRGPRPERGRAARCEPSCSGRCSRPGARTTPPSRWSPSTPSTRRPRAAWSATTARHGRADRRGQGRHRRRARDRARSTPGCTRSTPPGCGGGSATWRPSAATGELYLTELVALARADGRPRGRARRRGRRDA